MDRFETMLRDYFDASRAPADLGTKLTRRASPGSLLDAERTAARFRIEASERGVRRVELIAGRGELVAGRGDLAHGGIVGHRRHAERAREELAEYLAGTRTFFSVPVDLSGIPEFQSEVLAAAARIPYGEMTSYATLAESVGRPRAARAVGNALGANPVPVIVPCHRIIRGDGTWGHYVFGARMKTALLTLERQTPALVGSATTRIVCRHGCAHEQRVQERHRIVFASVADAKSVGYRPCHVCRPAGQRTKSGSV
jgi:O-6-methylguanine DNA methyltransferase